jgi:hypothetical protein
MPNGLFNLKQQQRGLQQGAWTGQKTPAVNYLVVAGGGGGSGAGGGAGGLLQGNIPVATGSAITVTIGSGGSAATASSNVGTNGGNSVFGSITATGGGYGASYFGSLLAPSSGGSGGGSYYSNNILGAQGVSGQGNRGGGQGSTAGSGYAGGGGGGAGTVGINSVGGTTNAGAGNGGAGVSSDISGTRTTYAGGGGSGSDAGTNAAGGAGGGGTGYVSNAGGSSGTANTGGGGGGNGNGTAGAGGSGIVIISYPDTYAAATSTTGSPTVSTSGSGSVYFDGSSYFSYNAQTPFAFGTGDFTIEFWIYATSFGGGPILFDCRPSATNGLYPTIYCLGTGRILFFTNSADAITGNILSTSTWYHIAVCRTGTSTKMYINGTQAGSTYTDSNNYLVGSGRPTVGGNGSSPGSSGTFYMSNVRVTKGVCVYTGNFTAPTAPLQATQAAGTNISAITGNQTSLLLNAVSGSFLADSSTNSYAISSVTGTPAWNQLSPFSTGLGYKNRVYTWTSSGSITF